MQRRFNYTDRIRLLQKDIQVILRRNGDVPSFDAILTLAEYALPPDSLVFVEAYRQTSWMRFNWGTVGELSPPSNRYLTEFESTEDILFRVRITSPGTPDDPRGLLIAEADRICLRGPDGVEEHRDSLLPIVPADLGDELWRIDFTDRPRLLVNKNAGNYRELWLNPAIVGMIYPAAMREILHHILLVEDHRDFDDSSEPSSQWLRFAVQVLAAGEPPKAEDGVDAAELWVSDASARFSRQHKILDGFRAFWDKEVGA